MKPELMLLVWAVLLTLAGNREGLALHRLGRPRGARAAYAVI